MEYGLYRLELNVMDSSNSEKMDMSLTGKLTEYGKQCMAERSDFKGMIDEMTLAVAKVMEKWYGDKTEAKDYAGRACKEPTMREFLESTGAKPREEGDGQEGMCNSGMPAPPSVHPIP